MNRREMLRRLAIGASGLVVAESVRDFMAWEARRIFALGGVPGTSYVPAMATYYDCHGKIVERVSVQNGARVLVVDGIRQVAPCESLHSLPAGAEHGVVVFRGGFTMCVTSLRDVGAAGHARS